MRLDELPAPLRAELLAAHDELKQNDRACRASLERLRKAQAAITKLYEASGVDFAKLSAILDVPGGA